MLSDLESLREIDMDVLFQSLWVGTPDTQMYVYKSWNLYLCICLIFNIVNIQMLLLECITG